MTTSATDGQSGHPEAPNRRSQLKSDPRLQLLSAAERLIAERGFLAVRLEDIGAAAGVSGPAIYRHFPTRIAAGRIAGGDQRQAGPARARDVRAAAPTPPQHWTVSSIFTSTLHWASPT